MIRRFSWRLVGATQVGSTPSKFLHVHDSFLTTTNAAYLDQMTADSTTGSDAESSHVRNSVPLYEWSDVMRRATQLPRSEPLMNHIIRPAEHPQPSVVDANSNVPSNAENGQARGVEDTTWLEKVARVSWMIRAWETRGHLVAAVDPLSLGNSAARQPQQCGVHPDELDPSFFGFSSRELDQTFPIGFSDAVGGLLSLKTPPMTLRELDQTLRRCYAGSVGYEFMHIRSVERTSWLRERIETPERVSDACTQPFTSDQRRSILRNLARAELFERFLHTKFVGVKRFGLDGAESLIPGMAEMLQQATDKGIEHVVIGMPHRGRLNVLANICQKPLELVFREFQGLTTEDLPTPECTGDVKYHLGISQTIHLDHGKPLHVTLLPNPSHLEAVNPLVEGTTRAKQTYLGGDSKVLSVQLHGDASFAGQGVCYETMGFCELENYRTGGTIHIVVNNQIGFTTDPKRSRSSPYCTDLGRLFGCPILHVNGDHPEDVVRAFRLAIDWRDRFKSSLILDLVCYRRYGHNESDEPMFTQPEMYRCIKKHPSVLTQYVHKLLEAGPEVLTMDHFESIQAEIQDRLKAALRDAPNFKVEKPLMRSLFWSSFKTFLPSTEALLRPTGLTMDRYQHLSEVVATIPESVKLHPVLKRVLQARVEALRSGRDLDWGAAEALAFGSLLQEGTAVRISGQDVERGTFSHRHAVVHDQDTDAVTCVLRDYGRQGGSHGTALFVASNSHLSEYAVLGFETGYSMEHPNTLVIWEAQFGDFANGAQIIFDQFLSSSEAKWNYPCGIVINLPHGYDGAGPEHSSGRLERFLQMVHEPEVVPDYTVMEAAAQHQQVNMQVVYPSTPANYFHVLRRQIHRNFRKPLILFYSKAFLRAPNVSQREDFLLSSEPTADGSSCGEAFRPVLPDPRSEVLANVTSVRRVVLCSGQISHYLLAEAKKHPHHKSVAILRLEQFAPFPHAELVAALSPFDAEAEVVWVQEEPRNMGAWSYLEFRLEHVLERVAAVKKSMVRRIPRYIGRPASASPATGHKSQHDREHRRILQEVF